MPNSILLLHHKTLTAHVQLVHACPRPMQLPVQGPYGQWLDPPPEPAPPDPPDVGSEGRLAGSVDRAPVTTGGLVIRGPSPRPRPQVTSAGELPITRKRTQVTMVTDGEAGPHGSAPSSRHRMKYGPMSPELGQQDFALGNPAAQSTVQRTLQRRLLLEHVNRAEDRAQAAYEQSCAALELISRSMEDVRAAFTEAKHARDRYYDLLSVSSRGRENARRGADASNPPAYVAGHQRRLRSGVLALEERREAQPSPVSTTQRTPSGVHCALDAHRARVHENILSSRRPSRAGEELGNTRSSAPFAVVRTEQVFPIRTVTKPTTSPPAGPQRTAGERVSRLDQYDHSSTCNPLDCEIMTPHGRQVHALVTAGTMESCGTSWELQIVFVINQPNSNPSTDAVADAFLALSDDPASWATSIPVPRVSMIDSKVAPANALSATSQSSTRHEQYPRQFPHQLRVDSPSSSRSLPYRVCRGCHRWCDSGSVADSATQHQLRPTSKDTQTVGPGVTTVDALLVASRPTVN